MLNMDLSKKNPSYQGQFNTYQKEFEILHKSQSILSNPCIYAKL